MDTETEEHILSELKRLRQHQSTLLVSHRVSTARHADQILVLDQGQIIEQGSHAELLAQGGYYAELERVQREGGEEEDLHNLAAVVMSDALKQHRRPNAITLFLKQTSVARC